MNKKLLIILCVLGLVKSTMALQITLVVAEPDFIGDATDHHVKVRFVIDETASASLFIFNCADQLVRKINSNEMLAVGEHTLTWDTKDNNGAWVPAGAYIYTLVATDTDGQVVEHDLTDLTGQTRMAVEEVKWNPEEKMISYNLPSSGMVNIRAGLKKNGPLLRTIQAWKAETAGFKKTHWDGKDASGVLDLTRHPKLDLWIDAFSFSQNSILIAESEKRQSECMSTVSDNAVNRVVKRDKPKQMYNHVQQSVHSRGDFTISLSVPSDLDTNPQGLPIVKGLLPITLDIDEADRERALSRRFEPVFFIDGTFAFENETGFLPMTWVWDPKGTNPGVHFLTVNLRGYEGNFGMATIKVSIPVEVTP